MQHGCNTSFAYRSYRAHKSPDCRPPSRGCFSGGSRLPHGSRSMPPANPASHSASVPRITRPFRAVSTVQPSIHTAVVIVAGRRLLASRDHLQTARYPLSRASRERVANDYHFRVRPGRDILARSGLVRSLGSSRIKDRIRDSVCVGPTDISGLTRCSL